PPGRRRRPAGAGLLPGSLCHCTVRHARRPRARPPRRQAARRPATRGPPMNLRVFVPCDAGAVAVGADLVARALAEAARSRKVALDIIRTGSRGLYWFEPMVEVETTVGRVAYGPVRQSDAASGLDTALGDGAHPMRLGIAAEIPWLKRQTRLTFARCGVVDPRSLDDFRAHAGCRGLTQAVTLGPEATIEQVLQSGLRG